MCILGIGLDWEESVQLKKLIGLQRRQRSVHSSKNTSQLPGLLALSASQFSDYIGAESKKVTDLPAQLEGIGLKEQNFKRRKKLRPTSILDILFSLLLLIEE